MRDMTIRSARVTEETELDNKGSHRKIKIIGILNPGD